MARHLASNAVDIRGTAERAIYEQLATYNQRDGRYRAPFDGSGGEIFPLGTTHNEAFMGRKYML